jgi:3-hydroxyacyl-[acyl-carrier-protein] dehydratase
VSWLASIPHAIPFRAASRFERIDAKSVRGSFFFSPSDPLWEGSASSPLMIIEAMAQIGGGLVFGPGGKPAFLSAIDRAVFSSEASAGDEVALLVTLDAEFGGVFRFSGVATVGEAEVARARFYLATGEAEQNA